MREIKFRGKVPSNGNWVVGSYIYDKSHPAIRAFGGGEPFVIPETVGQYTGIKDKNGVEIYEGDILLYTDGRCGDVQWKDCLAGFHTNDFRVIEREMEVIGNIYDNQRNART